MRRKLTQKQVAELAGITQNYYSELETGKKENPTMEVIFKLAAALEYSFDELYKGIAPNDESMTGRKKKKKRGRKKQHGQKQPGESDFGRTRKDVS